MDMDLKTLKAVVTAARGNELFGEEHPALYRETTERILYHLRLRWKGSLLEDRIDSIRTLASSPLTSNLLINLALAVNIDGSEMEDTKISSFVSELIPNEQDRRPPVVFWKALFNTELAEVPIIRHAPSQPDLNKRLNAIFRNLRSDMRDKLILGFGSRKGLSSQTQSLYKYDSMVNGESVPNHISAKDALRHFYRSGYLMPGSCQMKQKWYPTGLKPRTYYAQGGDAFSCSLFLRAFFNELADRLEYTNRFSRVDASRICWFDDSKSPVVYDFSSFTSNFSEQWYFLSELADFLLGTDVLLLFGDLTPISVDLGELVYQYRDVANDSPKYYYEDGFLGFCSFLLVHNQAGFLGVYGNLMTCTVPHGLVARQFVEKDSEVGCAGDDGIMIPYNIPLAVSGLKLLGDLADEKFRLGPWIYLKRRLRFDETGHGSLAPMPIFPNLSLMTSRFGRIPSRFDHLKDYSFSDYRCSTYQSIRTFLRTISCFDIGDQEAEIITLTINDLIRFCDLQPTGESHMIRLRFPHSPGRSYVAGLPMISEIDLKEKRYRRYPIFSDTQLIRRRKRAMQPFRHLDSLYEGMTFECNKDRYLSYLIDCGFIEELEESSVDEEECFDLVRILDLPEFISQGPEVFQFRARKDISASRLSGLFGMELEVLHKRQMVYEEFQEFMVKKRKKRGFLSTYFDLDEPDVDLVPDLLYDDVDFQVGMSSGVSVEYLHRSIM